MAERMVYQTFEVAGQFMFPLDMLRYDHCFPADQDAVMALAQALRLETDLSGRRVRPWRVQLGRWARGKMDQPTVSRWESFGVSVGSAVFH